MFSFNKSKTLRTNEHRCKEAASKLDSTPRQFGLPKQQDGLGHYISDHKIGEGKTFKYAVVATANPLTEDEMDNIMAKADKDVKEKPANRDVEHCLTLRGPITEISLAELIKERHKKHKYISVPKIVMLFRNNTSFASKHWDANVEIIDDRFDEQTTIRKIVWDTNIAMRMIMGIDFTMTEDELCGIYIRASCGVKNENMRWGTLIIIPTVNFLTGDKIQPFVDTWFTPVYSKDHLKARTRDPASIDSRIIQEDLEALREIYESGEMKDESKPLEAAESRECYEGTQFARNAAGPSPKSTKNRAAIQRYLKRIEEERGQDFVDGEVDTSETRMRSFVNDENGDSQALCQRDSFNSSPPTYRPERGSGVRFEEKGKGKGKEFDRSSVTSSSSGAGNKGKIPRLVMRMTSQDEDED